MSEIVKDPVCHMDVPKHSVPIEYEGIHFAFCSAQCKERFQANPRLYMGHPGIISPAQQGRQVFKQRRIKLAETLDVGQSERVRSALFEMMGIHDVQTEGNVLEIRYDLMQATAEQIADRLTQVGAEFGGGWVSGLRLAFVYYLEECEIGALEVENKKGCH
jgi:YHS domain-containing protein